ncbi:MAG TPA: PDZ domain-containing protein [Methylomirabilota bacterium]|nr:PDZ domain-containing protein [Methylomirabilota bacterium]
MSIQWARVNPLRKVSELLNLSVRLALLIGCAFYVTGEARAQAQKPLLRRDPSISKTQIAFSYAGNIWIANRDGGNLRRLTSGGHEGKPMFSPDGSLIAFTGNYDGTRGAYVVPTSGGEPRRLTYHPADDDVAGWTPDGKRIVFGSRRTAFADGVVQLFTVPLEGGFAMQVPLARAAEACFSPDGARIAYVPIAQWQKAWKRYRGGQTKPIWIASLSDSNIQAKIPRENSNDFNPMWVGDTIYFLSDRNGPVTLFAYDVKSQQVKQLVKNDGFDIKSASATSDAIVYEQFGSLHLFDLSSGNDRALDIRPVADLPEVRPHFQKIEPRRIRSADISPTGARAVFGVRGEILSVPAEKGDIRNLTNTVDVVERDPAWSPDGKSIAYLSDESGEYALHIRDQSGLGEVTKINLGTQPTFYYSPTWSPDSRKIGYTDKRLNYWYVDLEKKTPVHIDSDMYTDPGHRLQLAWSPDSKWIAYTKQLRSHLHAVFVYSLDQIKSYQVTDGMSDALFVAWDKEGKYLYFTASTDAALNNGWLDMTSLQRPITRSVYVAVLKKDVPSPLAPESDEEKAKEAEKSDKDKMADADKNKDKDKAKEEKPIKVEIDFDGISQRILALPIPARNYYGLAAGKPGVLFLGEGPTLDPIEFEDGGPTTKIYRFEFKTRKAEQILDGVTSFDLSFNGEKMLYAKQNQWFITPAEKPTEGPPQPGQGGPLKLDSMEVYVDPRAEWKHMYQQVWRDERDFLYDPGLHGLKLDEIKKKYEPFLDNIATRDDLNYLFIEMLGNITIGHMFVGGGDMPEPKRVKTGLLGADYSAENGRYRFARIYNGENWNPKLRAPLTQPGVNVQVGEYLLAVNGRDVRPPADVYSFFEETAGKQVVLKVGAKPDGSGARDVTVVPVDDESALRNYAWIEGNRRKVDELTGGRVAYVYLPDTYAGGFTNFNRYYFAQVGKDAAIIDERYNGGGDIADYVIDYLRRPLLSYWNMREGKDITTPIEAIFGPKVMVINEMAGSGGDALPWMFRKTGIGPLIGERTWGGLVGHYTNPGDLLDGGFTGTPDLAFYNPNGTWDVENHGVPPDVEVQYDPKAAREGHDSQLEKAVEMVMDLLKKNPPLPELHHPPYPNYQKSGTK